MPEDPTTIELDLIDLPEGFTTKAMAHEALNPTSGHDIKLRALAKLGITPQPDERPLQAWIAHLHRINDLEPQTPAHPAITEAIQQSTKAVRFLWLLA